ncbi:hypothetical protein HNP52_003969 [Sphingomonas kyeonggiensis]|uniref:Uncharacterized protein n=1 Tax=Sphingomonas kyeonggiensis TaxID=1268553 RepID=A0A7W7NUF7_9SPHN|nr:hypothetical protein [Sphingomonas kyeonggiensis]MBB4840872.1 hypothetical protein [Sphingomonas kyeonggiensis]
MKSWDKQLFWAAVSALMLTTGNVASAGSASQAAAGFTGRWSQRSSATETVLTSRLKLVPRSGGVGMDTRSVTEYAPVRVDRSMTLEVRPDGSYLWAIQLRKPHGQGCFMTTRQEKKGRLSASGDKVSFSTSGGTQSATNSCTGRTDTAPAPAMSETYTFSRTGNALRLRGTGGVDWTFTGG